MAKKDLKVEEVTPAVEVETPATSAPALDLNAFAAVLAKALAEANAGGNEALAKSLTEAMQAANPRQLTQAQRIAKGLVKTAFDAPKGKTKVFNHEYLLNRVPLNITCTHYDECEMLNKLGDAVPPGKYCNNFVTIRHEDMGNADGRKKIWISYPQRNADDRSFAARVLGTTFRQILVTIYNDAVAKDKARKIELAKQAAAGKLILEAEAN